IRASRDFRRSRCGAASKIAPNHGDAWLEEFVAVLEIFKNHEMVRALEIYVLLVASSGGISVTGIRSSSRAVFPFQNVDANRITETRTQSQANQSPNRV